MKKIAILLALISFSAFAHPKHPRHHHGNVCAVVYNSLDYSYSSQLPIQDHAQIRDLNHLSMPTGGDWDNRISKVAVAPGCTFIGYQYQDFNVNYYSGLPMNGFKMVLSNEYSSSFKSTVLDYRNEQISSIKCFCRN